ncbi:hypothetical protein A2U01_0114319, partial [Trifolium medium]|nr:hypothetical protein [Trifolium medium]
MGASAGDPHRDRTSLHPPPSYPMPFYSLMEVLGLSKDKIWPRLDPQ